MISDQSKLQRTPPARPLHKKGQSREWRGMSDDGRDRNARRLSVSLHVRPGVFPFHAQNDDVAELPVISTLNTAKKTTWVILGEYSSSRKSPRPRRYFGASLVTPAAADMSADGEASQS
jgi:hypothetical protein